MRGGGEGQGETFLTRFPCPASPIQAPTVPLTGEATPAASTSKAEAGTRGQKPPARMQHQNHVLRLLMPGGQIKRLLVDHPTGSGKTRTIIAVLDASYTTPQAKLIVFPKPSIARNFYQELLRWPNRYRDYYGLMCPEEASRASGWPTPNDARRLEWDISRLPETEVQRLCASIREELAMKGAILNGCVRESFRASFLARHPGEQPPGAPLRACSYSLAATFYSSLGEGGPTASLMKFGYDRFTGMVCNTFQNKYVVLDEAHTLLQQSPEMSKLRTLLASAPGSTIVGFTGTPYGYVIWYLMEACLTFF
jgi:hypothetical protein